MSNKLKKAQNDLDKLLDNIVTTTPPKQKRPEPSINEDFDNKFPTRKSSLPIPHNIHEKEISDVSDADENDIDRILRDTEELDGGFFKGVNKTNQPSLSKTMPASSFTANKPPIMKKTKSFEDDEDPLAGIDDILKPNNSAKPPSQTNSLKPANQNTNDKKPPLNSQQSMPQLSKPKTSLFDDVDDSGLLDNMGLEKPRYSFDAKRETTKRSISLVDDIFSSNDKPKQQAADDKNINDSKNFERNVSMSNASENNEQLDFSFGGYVPSSATPRNPGNLGPKRNVKFLDDLFSPDATNERPKTSPAPSAAQPSQTQTNTKINETNQVNPLTKSLPTFMSKSNYDWLGLSDDKNNNNNNDVSEWLKPKERNQPLKEQNISQPMVQQVSKPTDWLGLKDSQNSSFDKDNFDFDIKPKTQSIKNDMIPPIGQKGNTSMESSIIDKDESKHNQAFIKQQTKAILNSSFADSVENVNHNASMQNTSNNNFIFPQVLTSTVNPTQPKEMFNNMMKNVESASESGSDIADAWLNNLMSNKKMAKQQEIQRNNDVKTDASNIPLFLNTNNNTSDLNRLLISPVLVDENLSKTKQNFTNNTSSTNKIGTTTMNPPMMPIMHTMPAYIQPNMEYNVNDIQEMSLIIKQLEYQNQNLRMQLDYNKTQYDFELQMIKENCNNRLKLMKENLDNTNRHFHEEKDLLNKQIDLVEKEKYELIHINRKKCEEIQKENNIEIEKLKEIHKKSIENLKYEHELTIKRLKELKENEVGAAMSASSHTRTIETVLNSIQENTKNIDDLSQKVQINHMINLNEKEAEIKIKEDNLKLQEERLSRKSKEYENETRHLRETIQRLENHLAEQIKLVEEEKWKGKQQEKKLEALQEALLNEHKFTMEKLTRERSDVDRVKDDILSEQKRLMQQVYEEKRKLAEERAHLEAQLQSYKDRQHKDSLNNLNIEAEITVSSKYLKEEKARIEKLESSLKVQEEQLKIEKANLDERRREIDMREAKLEQIAFAVKQKYVEAENMYTDSNREKEKNSQLLKQVNSVKYNHENRLQQIQQQLALLNEKENRLNQEKVGLLKLRQELEVYKETIMCSKCKKPVKNIDAMAATLGTSGYGTLVQTNNLLNTINGSFTTKSANMKTQSNNLNFTLNGTIDEAKTLRQLKLQALKERQFLNQEKEFIDTLKTNLNRSYSLTQLNKMIS